MKNNKVAYLIDNEKLLLEWNIEKNQPISVEDMTVNSGRKVWWKCKEGHEWQARVADRSRGNGCPYCSGKKPLIGINDLKTLNQRVAFEWNYDLNDGKKPEEFCLHSGKRVWWKCKEGHEWQATIDSRTRTNGNGCPFCAGQRVIKGKNDIATVAPELANQWDYSKNGNLTPEEICINSSKKVWWKCVFGHEWCVSPNSRYTQKTGCSKCSLQLKTSYPEQTIFFYMKKIFNVVHSRYKLENRMELDIYIEDISTGIEYDGIVYHSSDEAKERDTRKDVFCKEKGIRLIRVKEVKIIPNIKHKDCIYRKIGRCGSQLDDIIKELLLNLGININEISIDVEKDTPIILSQYMTNEKLDNIPDNIFTEWDYDKNGDLKPEMMNKSSHRKVWWKCSKGHSWQATMQHRTDKNATSCPFCSNQKVLEGYNDLETVYPELIKEWNWELNDKSPKEYTAKSYHKVWWKCKLGHNWEASINKRVYGRGCPVCVGKKVLSGYNDLVTTCPNIASEWDYDKNVEYSPEGVTKGSNRIVWWKCKNGHSWEEMINRRVARNTKCPFCKKTGF